MKNNLLPYEYDIQYGRDSQANEGMVLIKIKQDGRLVDFMSMPAEAFLQIAHSVAIVARAVEADLYPRVG